MSGPLTDIARCARLGPRARPAPEEGRGSDEGPPSYDLRAITASHEVLDTPMPAAVGLARAVGESEYDVCLPFAGAKERPDSRWLPTA